MLELEKQTTELRKMLKASVTVPLSQWLNIKANVYATNSKDMTCSDRQIYSTIQEANCTITRKLRAAKHYKCS